MYQRIFDIFFSVIALCLLLPLLLPIALILRFTGEHEVFFIQKRIGKNGKEFGLLKFATMLKDSPNLGSGTITLKNDTRILPFGRVLRKTKINELPQLLNILCGDMSFIGPRPLTNETFCAYSREVQLRLSSVTPGLSGIGSIIFRDEEVLLGSAEDGVAFYHDVIAPYKGKLEMWYVDNISTVNYFKLISLTVFVVIFPKSRLVWEVLHDLPEPPEELQILK